MKSITSDAGFTLLELMIVVLIIGILGAVAYPRYSAYVCRGKQQSALAILQDARMSMEKYRGRENTYLVAGQPLNILGVAVDVNNKLIGGPSPYKLEITQPTNPGNRFTFTIRATCDPADRCYVDDDATSDQIEIDQSGNTRWLVNDCL